MANVRKDYSKAVKLYESGLSIGDVADYYGMTRQGMWDILRRRTSLRPQKRIGSQNHFWRGGTRASDQAQNLAEKALQRGVIARPGTCEKCGKAGTFSDGRTAIQGHHDDYSEPLKVRWLCQVCHHEWHKRHRAKGTK